MMYSIGLHCTDYIIFLSTGQLISNFFGIANKLPDVGLVAGRPLGFGERHGMPSVAPAALRTPAPNPEAGHCLYFLYSAWGRLVGEMPFKRRGNPLY